MTALLSADAREEVRAEVLGPILDLRALNDWQGQTIERFLDWLPSIKPLVPSEIYAKLVSLGWLLAELKGREAQIGRGIARWADDRTDERHVGGRSLNRQDLAAVLRPILDPFVAGARGDPLAYVRADRQLTELRHDVPDRTLLSGSLRRNLGPTKADKLAELVQLDRVTSEEASS